MYFSQVLEQYMTMTDTKVKVLAQRCGISESTIRRYYNGTSVPSPKSENIRKIADRLAKMASESGYSTISRKKVETELKEAAFEDSEKVDYEVFSGNILTLIEELDMSMTVIARSLNIDLPSFSRICAGKRKPRDLKRIIEGIAGYVVENYRSALDIEKILELTDGYADGDPAAGNEDLKGSLEQWLSGRKAIEDRALKKVLGSIDDFDVNTYLRALDIGEIRIPQESLQTPTNRIYVGMEGMREGVLEFFKATVSSRSKRDVVVYCDNPIVESLKEHKFIEDFEKAVAMLLVKGLNIRVIHNLDRPLNEIMIGMEGWIPLYMTGRVKSYYLENPSNKLFHHLLMVSGSAAVSGEAITGHLDKGTYNFVRINSQVGAYHMKAEQLLEQAKPLMDVYRKTGDKKFQDFWAEFMTPKGKAERYKTYTTLPPIFTISDELLERILVRNGTTARDKKRIRKYVETEKQRIGKILEATTYTEEFSPIGIQEFTRYPLRLSLCNLFLNKDIFYTYDEYMEHVELIREFEKKNRNYRIVTRDKAEFRNIRLIHCKGKGVLLSKVTSPAMHFFTDNPKICEAVSNMELVLVNKSYVERHGEK